MPSLEKQLPRSYDLIALSAFMLEIFLVILIASKICVHYGEHSTTATDIIYIIDCEHNSEFVTSMLVVEKLYYIIFSLAWRPLHTNAICREKHKKIRVQFLWKLSLPSLFSFVLGVAIWLVNIFLLIFCVLFVCATYFFSFTIYIFELS